MAVSLTKGGNVNLSKTVKDAGGATLDNIVVGLGWDIRATDGAQFDLDASAFLLQKDGQVRSDADFIFYNAPKSTDGSVEYGGDNRTGEGEGDDETVKIKLSGVSPEIDKVAITVTIDDAETRKQNFGMVGDAYVRVVNAADGSEIARYDLSEDAATETAFVFGEVYRAGDDWKFRAVGQGFAGGLAPLARNFGVNA